MKRELEKKLVERYPNLYKNYGGDMRKTCMHWGFECGDGWYGLIDRLSTKLEPLSVVALQVKQKFGELRFYIEGGSDEVDDFISDAVAESCKTCERCGKEGELRSRGWLKTLCDECEEKRRR